MNMLLRKNFLIIIIYSYVVFWNVRKVETCCIRYGSIKNSKLLNVLGKVILLSVLLRFIVLTKVNDIKHVAEKIEQHMCQKFKETMKM